MVEGSAPERAVPAVVGLSAAVSLGVREDIGLLVAAVASTIALRMRNRR